MFTIAQFFICSVFLAMVLSRNSQSEWDKVTLSHVRKLLNIQKNYLMVTSCIFSFLKLTIFAAVRDLTSDKRSLLF